MKKIMLATMLLVAIGCYEIEIVEEPAFLNCKICYPEHDHILPSNTFEITTPNCLICGTQLSIGGMQMPWCRKCEPQKNPSKPIHKLEIIGEIK